MGMIGWLGLCFSFMKINGGLVVLFSRAPSRGMRMRMVMK